MTWSYDESLPTSVDTIRFLVGDTDESDPQLSDEGIQYFVDTISNLYLAAAQACQTLATKYSRMADQTVGGVSRSYSQISTAYAARSGELTSLSSNSGTMAPRPYAGGISVADKVSEELDSDRVPPYITSRTHKMQLSDDPPSGVQW